MSSHIAFVRISTVAMALLAGLFAFVMAPSGSTVPHLANMATLSARTDTAPVDIDGTIVPGDGGQRRMVLDRANACGAGGHPTADGFTCVDYATGSGSWNIDWRSVGQTASECLFENAPASTDDTNAMAAAIATGKTVVWCKNSLVVTHDIPLSAVPYQIIRGSGRDVTFISVPSPRGFHKGIFVSSGTAAAPVQGPDFRDFSVAVYQPQSATALSALLTYPPLFYLENTPGFHMQRIGCYLGTVCIDMKGNSGESDIDKLRFNAFATGIKIDGSLGTVEITDPDWYPYLMGAQLQSIFYTASLGLSSGRMDHLVVRGGTFFGGQAMKFFSGATGNTFANITETDFDNYSGIKMSAGEVMCSSCTLTGGAPTSQLLYLNGGFFSCSSCFLFGSNAHMPPLINLPPGSTAFVAITASLINTNSLDINSARVQGGALNLIGNHFLRVPGTRYDQATMVQTAGRLMAHGNYCQDRGSGGGTGAAISIGKDGGNNVQGNTCPSWGYTIDGIAMRNSLTPTPGGGIYAGNN